ncbi:MAG: lipocalin-like domain-containing protein [Casimicrobiaceae bacterium]
MHRRPFLLIPLLLAPGWARATLEYPPVLQRVPLQFPRDHGSHAAFRTEWWYITGWVTGDLGRELGVQVTFFRSRTGIGEDSRSAFTPSQLLFAHAAFAESTHGRLRHDQRVARMGLGLAEASTTTTDVRVDDWSLVLAGDRYAAKVLARDFTFDLTFTATTSVLPQGEQGWSRKGPRDAQASYYYSRPQLATAGTIGIGTRLHQVRGTSWLDHEWSSAYLAPEARGWDWLGLNLEDGGALMLFRIRAHDGGVFWAGGTWRNAAGVTRTLRRDEISFTARREWRSPRTGVVYPVAFDVRAAGADLVVEPLLDDQELDARGSVGTIYWEGAVRVSAGGRVIGRGYLELTGYGAPLRI